MDKRAVVMAICIDFAYFLYGMSPPVPEGGGVEAARTTATAAVGLGEGGEFDRGSGHVDGDEDVSDAYDPSSAVSLLTRARSAERINILKNGCAPMLGSFQSTAEIGRRTDYSRIRQLTHRFRYERKMLTFTNQSRGMLSNMVS